MGFDGFNFNNAAEIFAEHCALTEGTNIDISGLSYEILKEKRSVQWPYLKGETGFGTKRLFQDHEFFTPSAKAIIHAVPDANTSEEITDDLPLILTTGRIRDQWHTMSRTGKVNKLKQHVAEAFLEIHPVDAETRGIKESDVIEVTNRRGNVRVKARLSEDIKRGVVFLPMHWGKVLNSNLNSTK